jgi:hypothetical protein
MTYVTKDILEDYVKFVIYIINEATEPIQYLLNINVGLVIKLAIIS